MKKTYSSPCIRCGRERVVARIWEEKIDGSLITNTETVCPDPACQKLVNIDIKRQQDKHAAIRLKNEQRILNRKALRDAERAERKQSYDQLQKKD